MYNKEYYKLIVKRMKAYQDKDFFLFYKITTKMYFFPLSYYYSKIKNKIWFKAKLKSNEFNHSLSMDIDKYGKMNDKEKEEYDNGLVRKRNLAHNLDLEED